MLLKKPDAATGLRRYDMVVDETASGGKPFLRPAIIMWNRQIGQSIMASYVQPHLPYTSGICAYYEQDCFSTRYFSLDTSTGSHTDVGVFVDSSGGGMSSLTNPPDVCFVSNDSSTTKVKGYCYDTWDSNMHRRTALLNGDSSKVIYGSLCDKVPFAISRCVIVATRNLIPVRFLNIYGMNSSSEPTSCTYSNINETGNVRYLGQKTYNYTPYNIYIMSSTSQDTNAGNYYYFFSNPCIGMDVIDSATTWCEASILYAATELNIASS